MNFEASESGESSRIDPTEIQEKVFSSAWKGYRIEEVRSFLARVAIGVKELSTELESARARISELGAEGRLNGDVVASQVLKAEETAAQILHDANEAAKALRDQARNHFEAMRARAEEEARQIMKGARDESRGLLAQVSEGQFGSQTEVSTKRELDQARSKAAEIIERSKAEGRAMIDQARDLRNEILADLRHKRAVLDSEIADLATRRIEAYQSLARAVQLISEAGMIIVSSETEVFQEPEAQSPIRPEGQETLGISASPDAEDEALVREPEAEKAKPVLSSYQGFQAKLADSQVEIGGHLEEGIVRVFLKESDGRISADEVVADQAISANSVEEQEPVDGTNAVEEQEPVDGTNAVEEKEPVDGTNAVEEKELVDGTNAVEEKELVAGTNPVEEQEPVDGTNAVEEKELVDGTNAVEESVLTTSQVDIDHGNSGVDQSDRKDEFVQAAAENMGPKVVDNPAGEEQELLVLGVDSSSLSEPMDTHVIEKSAVHKEGGDVPGATGKVDSQPKSAEHVERIETSVAAPVPRREPEIQIGRRADEILKRIRSLRMGEAADGSASLSGSHGAGAADEPGHQSGKAEPVIGVSPEFGYGAQIDPDDEPDELGSGADYLQEVDIRPPSELDAATVELLDAREEILAPTATMLFKKVKRLLSDEQNDLLDKVRRSSGSEVVLEKLLDEKEQIDALALAALDFFEQVRLGVAELFSENNGSAARREISKHAVQYSEEFAKEVVLPMRRRIEEALALDTTAEDQATAAAVGAIYRDVRSNRLEPLISQYVNTVFCATIMHESGYESFVWVTDPQDTPCADCLDNSLAGATICGEEFPTGHSHPGIHSGCRCLLVPIIA
ncbi:MAG: DivIVA domain-containing protein [Actinomycetota bacterium]|nr:DivIVA domain-containing protein [Actinomycetota bacterium]